MVATNATKARLLRLRFIQQSRNPTSTGITPSSEKIGIFFKDFSSKTSEIPPSGHSHRRNPKKLEIATQALA
jgi:hypothetical protein